jgi:hypothetical protein
VSGSVDPNGLANQPELDMQIRFVIPTPRYV